MLDARGQLTAANAYDSVEVLSTVSFGYDASGNLIQETLDPTGALAKTVTYAWAWEALGGTSRKAHRLQSIQYPMSIEDPTSRLFSFDYGNDVGPDADNPDNWLSRPRGLRYGTANTRVIDYVMTGGEEKVSGRVSREEKVSGRKGVRKSF